MKFLTNILNWIKSWFSKPEPIPTPPVTPDLPDEIEIIKLKLFELHNEQRQKRNIKLLQYNKFLESSAQKHNDWMDQNNKLSHSEPGRDLGERVREQGYDWKWVGENIAMGQVTAEQVMNSWMNSSGHKANILNGHFVDVGFGVSRDKRGIYWWTANFGAQ